MSERDTTISLPVLSPLRGQCRLYPIQGHEEEFRAGLTPDGRQVLMGCRTKDEVISVFFDKEGRILEVQTRHVSELARASGINPYEPLFSAKMQETLDNWCCEIGFRNEKILIQQFKFEDMGIDDLPTHYVDFLNNPASLEHFGQSKAMWQDEIRRWINNGMFVFWWGKDYWIDSDGNVEST